LVNLKTDNGRRQMRRIAETIVQEALELRGAISGEHGDGLSHTEFNARLFGPELTQAFHRWKRAFDPEAILNPGKVVVLEDAPPPRIDADLRYQEELGPPVEVAPAFGFHREQGFLRALEACNGVGVCRKDDGVMCPSFQATREEMDSTRGRANALRAALSGWLPAGSMLQPKCTALDLCLECKGCKAECPGRGRHGPRQSGIPGLVSDGTRTPLRSRLFADIACAQSLLGLLAPTHNRIRRWKPFRTALQTLRVDGRRALPAL
jgi:hypothetical protein